MEKWLVNDVITYLGSDQQIKNIFIDDFGKENHPNSLE